MGCIVNHGTDGVLSLTHVVCCSLALHFCRFANVAGMKLISHNGPSRWESPLREGPVIMLNVPCEKSTLSLSSLITEASLAGVKCLCARTYARWQGRAWQGHIWLLSGPWKCNPELEVLRCLFIAWSLGAWPYSLWHFQPLICRRIVMEYLFGVTLCSCHTIFSMAPRSCGRCSGHLTVGWNLSLTQSTGDRMLLNYQWCFDFKRKLVIKPL